MVSEYQEILNSNGPIRLLHVLYISCNGFTINSVACSLYHSVLHSSIIDNSFTKYCHESPPATPDSSVAAVPQYLHYRRRNSTSGSLYGGPSYRAIYDPCNPSIPDDSYTLAKLRTDFHYVVYSEENYAGESYTLTEVEVEVSLGFAVRSTHVILPEY